MKKWLVFLLMVLVCMGVAGSASASYLNLTVLGGSLEVDSEGGLGDTFHTTPVSINPATLVGGLPPTNGLTQIQPGIPMPDSGGRYAMGWWTFEISDSSLDDWNDVFAGGNWDWEIIWDGAINVNVTLFNTNIILPITMDTATFRIADASFADVYGKWVMNNPDVYTYIALDTPPNTDMSSATGIFGFVIGTGALVDYNLDELFVLPEMGASPYEVVAANDTSYGTLTATPVPPAFLLFGSTLLGLFGFRRKFKN